MKSRTTSRATYWDWQCPITAAKVLQPRNSWERSMSLLLHEVGSHLQRGVGRERKTERDIKKNSIYTNDKIHCKAQLFSTGMLYNLIMGSLCINKGMGGRGCYCWSCNNIQQLREVKGRAPSLGKAVQYFLCSF